MTEGKETRLRSQRRRNPKQRKTNPRRKRKDPENREGSQGKTKRMD